jgi:DNA-binding MarR family transcriptional regulator
MKGGPELFFLRDKPAMALLAIRELDPAYVSAVAKAIDSTVPHTLKVLAAMEGMGLVTSEPEGRIRRLALTPRGERAAAALSGLIDALQDDPQRRRLARMEEAVSAARGLPAEEEAFRIGPLRRDLAKLLAAEGEEVREAAGALDRRIVSTLGGGG